MSGASWSRYIAGDTELTGLCISTQSAWRSVKSPAKLQVGCWKGSGERKAKCWYSACIFVKGFVGIVSFKAWKHKVECWGALYSLLKVMKQAQTGEGEDRRSHGQLQGQDLQPS